MSETIYKMDKIQKNLLETFLTGRNQSLLFSKGNVNPLTEKPTIVDPDTNRPRINGSYTSDSILKTLISLIAENSTKIISIRYVL